MEIRPILSTLRKHRLTAILLTLQVATTCAIVCNVAFMVANRERQISLSTGIAENEISAISTIGVAKGGNPVVRHAEDLAALRNIAGVESVIAADSSLPLNHNDQSQGVCPTRQALMQAIHKQALVGHCAQASFFDGTQGIVKTLGLRLVEGRNFRPDEFVKGQNTTPSVAIISRAFAQALFPGQDALGKMVYFDPDQGTRIIGVVDTLLRPYLRKPDANYDSVIVPELPDQRFVTYVLRSAPQERHRVLEAAKSTLLKLDPSRIIDSKNMQTYSQIRAQYFQRDTTMIGLLIASALGLLFVTALGITGLANFWVQQRTRTIGIRRAIGATRADILRYFQTENFVIVTFGVVLGVALAIGLNLLLMTHYELPRLPLWYLPVGAVVLWVLGQLAVLAPALRASRVPPVVATRSV
ncbi:MAG TPA: FtsX-like permease family protein [Rhodanobacteraceae bacterium]|nr:FtsX-like permease family protein [Rhodanobacteraceae bacterium]